MKLLLKSLIFLISILFAAFNLYAGAPDTIWTRTYGGIAGEVGNSVKQTIDGGYIIAGFTSSYGARKKNVYLIMVDSIGDTLWTRTFGGIDYDEGTAVLQTPDEGFAVAGYSYSAEPSFSQCYLIKTNDQGDSLWARYYGGAYRVDKTWSMDLTNDRGYILAGVSITEMPTIKNVYIIKVDSSGYYITSNTFGGWFCCSEAYSVQQTADFGYIVAGYRDTSCGYENNSDVLLIKTDSLTDSLWAKIYGGEDSDKGYSVKQTEDGGYIIVGYTKSFGLGATDFYLIKTDSIGDTLWTRTFGGNSNEIAYSVEQTQDKGYIIAGFTESFGAGKSDFWLVRTDSLGDTIWTRTYGGYEEDKAYCIQQTSDGGYIVSGFTSSYGAGGLDVYLIKIESDAGVAEDTTLDNLFVSQGSPNPFYNITSITYDFPKRCHVKIIVYSMLGQIVRELENEIKESGKHTVIWDGKDNKGNKLQGGIYFLNIEAGDDKATRKLLLIR